MKVYIETFGCAMNHKDSENILAKLKADREAVQTDKITEADLIIINTCSVREKPIQKLFSELGSFNAIKKSGAKIGVAGCTASHLGREIIQKAPYVNFVLGARNISKIISVLDKKGAVEIDIENDESLELYPSLPVSNFRKSINISIGCDKQCSFCIVPFTRGEEISIPTDLIISETQKAVKNGAKEVLLLGQNVNNYGRRFSSLTPHRDINFTGLLKEISNISGLERIRFTSPHPLHMDNKFIEEFATNPKIAKGIHMPLQSGSNKILKMMKRGYTREWFIDRVERIRRAVPEVAISTDIIVGFPDESDSDFNDTLELLNIAKFEQLFSFKYSPRPLTEAKDFKNQIADDIASERLIRLQAIHQKIMEDLAINRKNKIYSVLFDSFDSESNCLIGRTSSGLLVKAKGEKINFGEIRNVKIIESMRTQMKGQIIF